MIAYEVLDVLTLQKETIEKSLEEGNELLKQIHPLMVYQKGKLEGMIEVYKTQLTATNAMIEHIQNSLCANTVTH